MTILVTGGAGFIGSNFVKSWIRLTGSTVVSLDKLTYAGNLSNLAELRSDSRHVFVRGDVCDMELVADLLRQHRPRGIVHLAAESHVDRSIHSPSVFITTNVNGTHSLLEAARQYWGSIPPAERSRFRFLHVSTDEVYGPLEPDAPPALETARYAPSSPYAASKAASDHLVHAYNRTYGLPTIIAHCCNNYGPFQYPEKLIPRMIANAIRGLELPIYGDGQQVRDWLYVEDNCAALQKLLRGGRPGETYNVGCENQRANIAVVQDLCSVLDRLRPRHGASCKNLIAHVADRPGHDRRYAMDTSRIRISCGWVPSESFDTGIEKTVRWYLDNERWLAERDDVAL